MLTFLATIYWHESLRLVETIHRSENRLSQVCYPWALPSKAFPQAEFGYYECSTQHVPCVRSSLFRDTWYTSRHTVSESYNIDS